MFLAELREPQRVAHGVLDRLRKRPEIVLAARDPSNRLRGSLPLHRASVYTKFGIICQDRPRAGRIEVVLLLVFSAAARPGFVRPNVDRNRSGFRGER